MTTQSTSTDKLSARPQRSVPAEDRSNSTSDTLVNKALSLAVVAVAIAAALRIARFKRKDPS